MYGPFRYHQSSGSIPSRSSSQVRDLQPLERGALDFLDYKAIPVVENRTQAHRWGIGAEI